MKDRLETAQVVARREPGESDPGLARHHVRFAEAFRFWARLGPLIMVLQFIGFMAGWNNPQGLSPAVSGVIGAMVTTYTTFLPCFLFIFLGAPYIEVLRGNKSLTGALTGITASVVGLREGAMLRVEESIILLKGVSGARVFRRGHDPAEIEPGAKLNDLVSPAR